MLFMDNDADFVYEQMLCLLHVIWGVYIQYL